MDHAPGFLKLVKDAKAGIKETDVAGIRGRLAKGENPILVDVREDNEWAKGRIPGARHIGRGILERDVEKELPDHSAEIILYCGGGFRSALAAESLQKMGYTNVWSMDGGWRGWLAAKGEVEK
ncbi:MAG: sulfurtransferase [Elusimicrobia bacterium]|nr:sulfurtransferase [Elusimicrobiota bacterium]